MAQIRKGVRLTAPKHSTPVLTGIMTRCWATQPEDRVTFEEIVEILNNLILNLDF